MSTVIDPKTLDEIEAAAKAATPGSWNQGQENRGDDPCMVYCDDATGQRVADTSEQYLFFSEEQKQANAAHIAACDPPTVLALIDALRSAQAEIERAQTRPSTSQAIVAVEKLLPPAKQAVAFGIRNYRPMDYAAVCDRVFLEGLKAALKVLRDLPADPFNPLSYAAGARRAVDVAKRVYDTRWRKLINIKEAYAYFEDFESFIETELAGSAGEPDEDA